MKVLKMTGIIVMCCILYFESEAQQSLPLNQTPLNKPALFSRLPEKFIINILLIEELFNSPVSGTVKIPLVDNNFFEGSIVEKVQKNANVVSISIRSSNYDGAFFNLSKITRNHQAVTYIGRIVSIRNGDVLMLTMDNNQLYFTKEKQSLLLVE